MALLLPCPRCNSKVEVLDGASSVIECPACRHGFVPVLAPAELRSATRSTPDDDDNDVQSVRARRVSRRCGASSEKSQQQALAVCLASLGLVCAILLVVITFNLVTNQPSAQPVNRPAWRPNWQLLELEEEQRQTNERLRLLEEQQRQEKARNFFKQAGVPIP